MPGSYLLLPEHRFVYSRAWGVLTEATLVAHSKALAKDPRFEPSFTQLADMSEVREAAITAQGVRRIASVSPFGAGAHRAFVGTSDVVFGLSRMCVSLLASSEDEIMVFRDLEAAAHWLGPRAPANWRAIAALPPDWLSVSDGPAPEKL